MKRIAILAVVLTLAAGSWLFASFEQLVSSKCSATLSLCTPVACVTPVSGVSYKIVTHTHNGCDGSAVETDVCYKLLGDPGKVKCGDQYTYAQSFCDGTPVRTDYLTNTNCSSQHP